VQTTATVTRGRVDAPRTGPYNPNVAALSGA